MAIDFDVSDSIPATPDVVFTAWLDSKKHTAMTGGQAKVSARIGEKFKAWDGYIEGVNLEIESPKRILQHWRTNDFKETDEDSLLEVLFQPEGDGTKVTILHSNLPEHGMQYQQGWIDAYFTPMKAYFGSK